MNINPVVKIVASEFWLNGKLACPCCVLFIVFRNHDCLQALFNDEFEIWEVKGTHKVPDFVSPEHVTEYYYPYKDYTPNDMNDIGTLASYSVLDRTRLDLAFSKGVNVRLIYNEDSEETSIQVEST